MRKMRSSNQGFVKVIIRYAKIRPSTRKTRIKMQSQKILIIHITPNDMIRV